MSAAIFTADPLLLSMAMWQFDRLEAEERRERERQHRMRQDHPTFWRQTK